MADDDPLEGTPYFFIGGRSPEEERLLSYIRREHQKGRHLGEILDDQYVAKLGSKEFVWRTLIDTPLIELLDQDVREDLQRASAEVSNQE